jgi:hypothetical protein
VKEAKMIKNANDMIKALKRDTYCGVILYQGPSLIDGAPIVVIANRIVADSTNAKTGAMVQTFIIRQDMRPLDAARLGYDFSVCGHCPHRPTNAGSCYVNISRSVESVFGAYKRGRYAVPHVDYDTSILPELFADSVFRLGSYGDPAAAPFRVWAHATTRVKARNGYTHQWREFPQFAALCMASVDSETEATEARSSGWRTFRVRAASAPVMAGEIACPASEEAGKKTTCADCKACGGLSAKARASIAIIAHGTTKARFAAAA